MIKNYKKAYRNRIDENSITPQQEDSHVDKSRIKRLIKINRYYKLNVNPPKYISFLYIIDIELLFLYSY